MFFFLLEKSCWNILVNDSRMRNLNISYDCIFRNSYILARVDGLFRKKCDNWMMFQHHYQGSDAIFFFTHYLLISDLLQFLTNLGTPITHLIHLFIPTSKAYFFDCLCNQVVKSILGYPPRYSTFCKIAFQGPSREPPFIRVHVP